MARRKSATRRNKSFKSVDPFAKGKSTKGLGTDQGFDYGGRAEIKNPGKMLKKMKGQKMVKKEKPPPPKRTTQVHKLLIEGTFNLNRTLGIGQKRYDFTKLNRLLKSGYFRRVFMIG